MLFFCVDGFFDAGMLLSALKAKEEGEDRLDENVQKRREIGRRLILAEY